MTASTDQFVDIAKRSQEAVTDSLRTWTETVQGFAGQFTGGTRPQLPDTTVAVDRVFDFAEQMLAQQRELTKTVVGASRNAVETMTEQAAKAAESVTEHVSHAAGTADQATKDAAEKAAGAARSTRAASK
ncbi:hypothetical protein EV383_2220 [Pseudonocardia sediminis]|uniref:Uncharacterized protein n=1 Tax=Pseudonocardia sediminis TaxID=1397368 RepID=A0A4Q7UUD4_PSEST|nr:hypothetical protein [Pseudonocardia sediminis]RZT85355.1 hypothetical protein EV383_2220 [Pseudonocardia sediminis]